DLVDGFYVCRPRVFDAGGDLLYQARGLDRARLGLAPRLHDWAWNCRAGGGRRAIARSVERLRADPQGLRNRYSFARPTADSTRGILFSHTSQVAVRDSLHVVPSLPARCSRAPLRTRRARLS